MYRAIIRFVYSALLVIVPLLTTAQPDSVHLLRGTVFKQENGTALPYARVQNISNHTGTLTNPEGYFEIPISGSGDSIKISFVGYTPLWVISDSRMEGYAFFLEERSTLLSEVSVVSGQGEMLADLLTRCKADSKHLHGTSKLYYELHSYIGKQQVELIECFYNGQLVGYDLTDLELKTGRIALQRKGNRFFVSLESSKAISMMKLFTENEFFPKTPLEFPRKKMLSTFNLYLSNRYADENLDTISIVRFVPRNDVQKFFEGKIWVHETKERILRMELVADSALTYPFLPIFGDDRIENVNMRISRTFDIQAEHPRFDRVDFTYEITYHDRTDSTYIISTQVVLNAYAPEASFELPRFEFSESGISDYRKINAMPYNRDFWTYQQEFHLTDQNQANARFFADERSITNQTMFKPNEYTRMGFLEHPYITWSPKRIVFREMVLDTSTQISNTGQIKSRLYELRVKIFMDVNRFSDSLYVLTSAVFDPYETYYYLPVDRQTICFMNLYFDLVECERRTLQTELNQAKTQEAAFAYYEASQLRLQRLNASFFADVERGTVKDKMIQWNETARAVTGIDNLELYKPFEEEAQKE